MASRNGQTMLDMVNDGFWKRSVQELNDDGTLGVSIPHEFADEHGVSKGDNIVLKSSEQPDAVLEVHVK